MRLDNGQIEVLDQAMADVLRHKDPCTAFANRICIVGFDQVHVNGSTVR